MSQITKEQLIREKARLQALIDNSDSNDENLRREFSMLLAHYVTIPGPFVERETKTMSWLEIFFRVGELNSDANYTILLEQKRSLEIEVEKLKRKLEKHPKFLSHDD